MAATATVRISDASRRALRELSDEEKRPMQVVLDRAIEDYRRLRFLDALNESFTNVREHDRRDEQQERDEWDTATRDGVEAD